MESKDLNTPDFTGSAAGAFGAAAMVQASQRAPKWVRWFLYVCIGVTVLAVGAGMIDKIGNIDSLPACDAKRTRDTMSDLNKANQLNATAYNFIKQVSASDTEITCTANLALKAAARSNTTTASTRRAGASRCRSPNGGGEVLPHHTRRSSGKSCQPKRSATRPQMPFGAFSITTMATAPA